MKILSIQKLFIFFLPFLLVPVMVYAQTDSLSLLLRNSYAVFELQRSEKGIYRDSKLFDPQAQDFHPSSVANCGMGLISLCIADSMGWDSLAEAKVLQSLWHILGYEQSFQPDRNPSGYYRHFIEMDTGARAWNSEYSSIDTGILMAGALFCKKYFPDNDSLAILVEELWNSIDWGKSIANPSRGEIYLSLDSLGDGIPTELTRPFNEYMLLAWFAKVDEPNPKGPAHQLWQKYYANPDSLLTNNYVGFSVLTDLNTHYLSSFVSQFCYYLCHPFGSDSSYLEAFRQIRKADSAWWAAQNLAASSHWGLGAGSAAFPPYYHPSAIHNNPQICFRLI